MLDLKNSSHIIQLLDETVQLLDYRVVKLEVFGLRCCLITEMLDYRVVGLEKSSRFTWLFRLYMYLETNTWMFLIISKTSRPWQRKLWIMHYFLAMHYLLQTSLEKFHVNFKLHEFHVKNKMGIKWCTIVQVITSKWSQNNSIFFNLIFNLM